MGKVTYPNLSSVTFSYNILDQLVSMQDLVGTTSYLYDAAGRLTSQTNPHGFVVSYKYDEAGNLTELTYPGGKIVTYGYDALNRLTIVTNWLGQTATYAYDDAGRLTSLTNFNGTVTIYGYDDASRMTSISSPIASYSFTLDGNGNRTGVTQTEPLLPVVDGATAYGYNTRKNRLLTAGANSFGYDNEGQLTSGYGSSSTFDYEHRLTSMSGASFSYDGGNNRLQATRSGVTTRYIYDAGGNLLAEADGNSVITRYYVYGAGLLAMVTTTDRVYNYHYNAVGSTVAMTDDHRQEMVNKYAYDAFGAVANQVETTPQPFKYVGQFGVMSEPNGFYYMKARYYDPNVGRFISEDPLGFDGGDVNLMAYVQNNPVNYTDPLGLFWFRQDWQTNFVVGRERSLVEPGGGISRFIEDKVPAGRTFGDLHDAFVDAAHSVGIPDALANIPSMVPMYAVAVGTEVLRSLGILNQPTPTAQPTTTRQPSPCK